VKLADYTIIGATVPPQGKAAFVRANVVLQRRSESEARPYLLAFAYVGAEEVDGQLLTAEEWQAFLDGDQAVRLDGVRADSGIGCWVLRSNFQRREAAVQALRTSGALLRDFYPLAPSSYAFLVRESAANSLRDEWAKEAAREALSWAKGNHWQRACDEAGQAFVLERSMTPERVAMLSLAYEKCENAVRASGYLEMARRSRGDQFGEQVVEKRKDLERELAARVCEPDLRPQYVRAVHERSERGISAAFARWKVAA
jgi:hypothetical protein